MSTLISALLPVNLFLISIDIGLAAESVNTALDIKLDFN